MNRIITGIMLALPIVVATSLPKLASAQEAMTNPQLHRASGQPEYLAQYDGRYQQQERGRYQQQERGQYQRRRTWVAGHYEYRNHRRVFVPAHYIYR